MILTNILLGQVPYSSNIPIIRPCNSTDRIENHFSISWGCFIGTVKVLAAINDLGAFVGITAKQDE